MHDWCPGESDGPVEGQVQHDGHHDGQGAGWRRDAGGEVHLVVVEGSEHFLGEPSPGLADPGELAAFGAVVIASTRASGIALLSSFSRVWAWVSVAVARSCR